MKLELKESNSPFWLIGASKTVTFAGSSTNIPCYSKTAKKQREIAEQIFKNEKRVTDVYLITGTQWDNMPSGGKEELGYLKNKGKLILSKNDVMECDYPKGVSRDPLPKKGAKVYTSPATALEEKEPKFKPELKESVDDDISILTSILTQSEGYTDTQPTVNGWYILVRTTYGDNDYWFRYDKKEKACSEDYKQLLDYINTNKSNVGEIRKSIIMTDGKEDVVWMDYPADGEKELSDAELKSKFDDILANGGQKDFEALSKDEIKLFAEYVKSRTDLSDLIKGIILRGLSFAHGDDLTVESKNLNEAVPWKAIATGAMYAVDNWDVLKDMIETIKAGSAELYERIITIFEYLRGKNGNPKDAAQEIASMVAAEESLTLKESKIVTPVGNPQTAASFVNIDVDLDHMEISDFIVRLSQAIRSEETAILEYVALRSANGITNEDRAVIDGIIEEEKNHLAAITTLLYKQITMNHSENVDKANAEFTLPKFGIFDTDGKLTESISNLVKKIISKADKNESVESTAKGDVFEITADVEYESDAADKTLSNIQRAAEKLNKANSTKYIIQIDTLKIQDSKLYFKLDNKTDSLSDTDLEKIVNDLAKESSTYDLFVKVK